MDARVTEAFLMDKRSVDLKPEKDRNLMESLALTESSATVRDKTPEVSVGGLDLFCGIKGYQRPPHCYYSGWKRSHRHRNIVGPLRASAAPRYRSKPSSRNRIHVRSPGSP